MKATRILALALAAWAVATLLWLFAHRVGYPYDLEWMEGGQIAHALRLVEGQPIYAPPSVDFVPYLYTPGYPVLLWLLAKVVGLGYTMARLVSVVSFAGALLLGYLFARREGGSRAAAAVALAIPAAAFAPTGAWYDLARPDSLSLGLITAAMTLGWWRRRSPAGVALAALLLVAAFFTKQTASPFMIALGLMLLVVDRRAALAYGATLAAVGLPLLWWANRASDGWFWTYVSRLHRQHDFYPVRAFVTTPGMLLLLVGPALLLVPWALWRARTPSLLYATWVGAVGAAVACVGFGTQWAHINAFIPGVFFLALAVGVAAGRLVADAPPRRPAVVFALLALGVAGAPGGLEALDARLLPTLWKHSPSLGYAPGRWMPTPAMRAANDALIARLRATPGEVLIPFHPFYAYLAGKRSYLHRMGVLDIARAGLGAPRGLADALAAQRFSLAVLDNKIDGNWQMWPGLQQHYHVIDHLAGGRMACGAETEPRYVMAPNAPPGVLDREP